MTSNKHREIKISKLLSLALRHNPNALNLDLDEQGWARVSHVLQGFKNKGHNMSFEDLERLVVFNDKQRFALSDDGERIRASQGHSINIDLGYQPRRPTDILYHGTATKYLDSIMQQGILKGSRHHVHLSGNPNTAKRVGERHGRSVVLEIDAPLMSVDGHIFYLSDNGVWLTEHIPVRYIFAKTYE